jgi:hypothetical protein
MRECKTCGLKAVNTEELAAFVPHRKGKHGYENKCKACKSEEFLQWRMKNPEYRTEYHLANKDKENQNSKAWLKANPEKSLAITRKYQAAKFSSIPSWFDSEAVNEIYREARSKGLEVDHIVPLQGKTVCGLHVQTNLRCVPMQENRSKSNKLLEEVETVWKRTA